jgi:hypothetical protein
MGPAARRGSSPTLLATQDQSWPPNDFDPRSAGRGAHAVEAAVSYLRRRSRVSDGGWKAHASGQDAPDSILPGPFASETKAR